MSLGNWVNNGWLASHETSRQEIAGLMLIAARELRDSKINELSTDGKFNHAYRAALTLATVVLYSSGYAPTKGQSHHYRVISALPLVLGSQYKNDSDYLNKCRTKRNASEYDSINEATENEADELVKFSEEFLVAVQVWLREKKPELL